MTVVNAISRTVKNLFLNMEIKSERELKLEEKLAACKIKLQYYKDLYGVAKEEEVRAAEEHNKDYGDMYDELCCEQQRCDMYESQKEVSDKQYTELKEKLLVQQGCCNMHESDKEVLDKQCEELKKRLSFVTHLHDCDHSEFIGLQELVTSLKEEMFSLKEHARIMEQDVKQQHDTAMAAMQSDASQRQAMKKSHFNEIQELKEKHAKNIHETFQRYRKT